MRYSEATDDRDGHFSRNTRGSTARPHRSDAPGRRPAATSPSPPPALDEMVPDARALAWKHANVVADRKISATTEVSLWAASFVFVLALFCGGTWELMRQPPILPDGNPTDAIAIDMVPDTSNADDKPDDAPGPKVVESMAPSSDQTQADDPDPPAPDSAPPTEVKHEAEKKAPELTAPPSQADASAVLPPPEKEQEQQPDIKPPVEKVPDAKQAEVERKTMPSQASTGSAALLSGGKRPSAAAQATWRGEIGTHLVHHRRYPQEARSKGWQGTARVKVKIDENGHVLDSELIKSTGQPTLDGEAIALMQRSDPFPKPPAGMPAPVTMTVPVNFAIH